MRALKISRLTFMMCISLLSLSAVVSFAFVSYFSCFARAYSVAMISFSISIGFGKVTFDFNLEAAWPNFIA